MRAYGLLGMLTVCSLLPLQGAFAQSSRTQPVAVVQAELLPSQTLPIHVTMAKLQNFDTGSELLIDLKKVQNTPTSRMMIDVYISHGKSLRHGQRIPVDLSGISSTNMSFRLQTLSHLMLGDTALVFVQEVQSPGGNQRISETDVIASIKAFVQGQFVANLVGKNGPAPSSRGAAMPSLKLASISGFKYFYNLELPVCQQALNAAIATCSGGISSFSCNPETGELAANKIPF